jgi:UDP-glucose 4-epimerase
MCPKVTPKSILVTGGAGFVGGNIAHELVRKGYEVTILDNLSRGFKRAIPKEARFVHGDIRNKNDVKKALKGVDTVIHCAAKLVIPESFSNVAEFLEVNVVGTYTLLDAMQELGVTNLVFSSSAGVYADVNASPIPETGLKDPYSPYGDSKIAMEHVMHGFYLANKMNVAILRYFNPYGPGYYVEPAQHAVPVFFEKALANEDFPVYGDGSMQRDYIYIDDLVDAHIKAMKAKGYNVYNVGAGKGTSINALVKAIIKVTGSQSKITYVPTPEGYPDKMYADILKIQKELGWTPKISLAEGIKKTYETFYKK